MKKFAVIDIGSNSVRLMFVADGKILYKRLQTTRLGEGIADKLVLKQTAIDRTAEAVCTFFRIAKQEGAEEVFAFATAAVRSAENGNEFVEKVKMLCGLEIEVVSGQLEAELGISGALGNADGATIDIGGASTEIVVRANGSFAYRKSVDIGVVRLKDLCGADREMLQKKANDFAQQFMDAPQIKNLYAIGGTATTIAALTLGLKTYDSEKVTGTEISKRGIGELAMRLRETPVEEIEKLPCMSTGRADVIAGGATLLFSILERLQIEKIIVSDRDNLEGYAIKRGLL